MTVNWNIVGALALLTLVAAPLSAQEKIKEGAENTKNAVVKSAKTGADTTKEILSRTGEVMTDGWITSRVHTGFLGEDLLKDSEIRVETNKHVVTLTGTVVGRAGRARAADIAKHTEGVHRVLNRLTLGPKKA
jgi:osmotically-inducible protein OsmY